MKSDEKKFLEAHEALEEMLEPLPSADAQGDARKASARKRPSSQAPSNEPNSKHIGTQGTTSKTDKTDSKLPLLVFVTPDFQYDKWSKPQAYEVSALLPSYP